MSSRLPTSAFRRSVSSAIVSRNSRRASGVQSTSSWSRLVTDALIPASGVRRSCETAERIAARSSFAAETTPAAFDLRLELAELDRRRRAPWRTLRARAGPRRESAGRRARARGRASRSIVVVAGLRAVRDAAAARRLDPPAALRRGAGPRRPRRQHAAQAVEHGVDRGRAGEAGERLGLGLRARLPWTERLAARSTKQADRRRDGEEHDEREDVLAFADRERVERRREVPVDEQEAADRGDERRPEAADAPTPTTSSRKRSSTLGSPICSAQVGEHVGEGGRADGGEHEPERDPPLRQ